MVLPFDPTGTMPLGVLTVENKSLDEANVKDVARIEVRNFLGSVPGCVAPVVVGGKDRTVLVYLDPKKMESRQLSPLDVVDALKQNNMMVTPGIAYFGNNQLLLDTNMMVDKVKELDDMPIRADAGDSVFLRDIGHAEDSYAIQTSRVHIDGRREVYVPIYRQQGASSLAVAEASRTNSSTSKSGCPAGHEADVRHGPVGLHPRGHPQLDRRGDRRRRPGLDHDPGLPGQLAHDADRQHCPFRWRSSARSSAFMSPATPSTP